MMSEYTPAEVREGVRSGILDAIERDVELRGGRAAQLLLAAGVVGVAGAGSLTLLHAPQPFGQHPPGPIGTIQLRCTIRRLVGRKDDAGLAASRSVGCTVRDGNPSDAHYLPQPLVK